ncbi:MAG: ATP-binding protein [Sutterella sp.]|nr:ATP-binding protein [Sutterella sp.]
MTFYGREQEMQALRWQFQRAQETKVARMAVVTGRRRIGKTTLIRKAFEGSLDPFIYYFVTGNTDEEEMAQLLVAQAAQCLDIRYPPAITKVSDDCWPTIGYNAAPAKPIPKKSAI